MSSSHVFAAATLESLFGRVSAQAGHRPVETDSSWRDNVYAVGDGSLLFVGQVPGGTDERRVQGVLLPSAQPVDTVGRENLVPPKGIYHDRESVLFRCALAHHLDAPLGIHGHTGVGKTELVRYFAALLGAPLYRMNLHGLSTTDDVIGKLLPVSGGAVAFQDGLVTTAVRNGGILLLEEMNATGQEVWFSLHGLLDGSQALTLVEKDNEVVGKHPSCRIYSTFNPAEYPNLYPGTKELSAAYLRRWISLRLDFASLDQERAILVDRFPELGEPARRGDLENMLQVTRAAREILQNRSKAFDFVLSTGTLETWARIGLHLNPLAGARLAFYDLLDERLKAVFREQIFPYATNWDLESL